MSIRKLMSMVTVSMLMLFAALPARAGVPVIDAANLAQAIQQVLAWGQQAEDMINQYNKLQQQYQQMQTMTTKLDGIRSLGTILNDPSIQAALPLDMRDSTHMLLNPSALTTSPANLSQILASFGVNVTVNPTAGQSEADTFGRSQQILTSAQARNVQLQQLAERVNSTVDAKDSLDMLNRNVLESANINNQMMQTLGSLDAARQAASLRRLAEDQAYFSGMKSAAAQPIQTYSY